MSYETFSMKSIAKQLNDRTYTDYYYRLMMIARSLYKWNGLPENLNDKWIEKFLFHEGHCCFFKDKDRGYMFARCTLSGKINCFDEPTKVTPYGVDYHGEPLIVGEECVLIDNNDCRIPTRHTIELFAYRLANIQRTIDVNVSQQKSPFIALCNEKNIHSIRQLFGKRDENEIVIYGDNALNLEQFKIMPTASPFVAPQLRTELHNVWNECMSFLGINNANQEKKERLVEAEVGANDEQVSASENVMKKSRERACEEINKLFPDLHISVEMRKPPREKIEMKEGAEDDF